MDLKNQNFFVYKKTRIFVLNDKNILDPVEHYYVCFDLRIWLEKLLRYNESCVNVDIKVEDR